MNKQPQCWDDCAHSPSLKCNSLDNILASKHNDQWGKEAVGDHVCKPFLFCINCQAFPTAQHVQQTSLHSHPQVEEFGERKICASKASARPTIEWSHTRPSQISQGAHRESQSPEDWIGCILTPRTCGNGILSFPLTSHTSQDDLLPWLLGEICHEIQRGLGRQPIPNAGRWCSDK